MTALLEIDLASEIARGGGLTLVELARQHRVNPSTVFRWLLDGLPRGDGTRVKLEAIRRGKRWLTTQSAVDRFFAALPTNVQAEATPMRSPATREKASQKAKRSLAERYGI